MMRHQHGHCTDWLFVVLDADGWVEISIYKFNMKNTDTPVGVIILSGVG